ncbi:MAG: hypothetical protein JW932_08570 [Deltaproteobacteria bacterium]|nr:hypothetical protein [Deltaproteobacteria bacterium]
MVKALQAAVDDWCKIQGLTLLPEMFISVHPEIRNFWLEHSAVGIQPSANDFFLKMLWLTAEN